MFTDHQIIQNILMEDINIPYDEWKTKVETPIKPIYHAIDKLIRNKFLAFPKLKISKSSKEHKQTRLRNTRAYWVYNNPKLVFQNDFYLFVQLGDYRASRKKTIFWGISYWVGGSSDEIDSVFHLFERINHIKVFKESGGVAGIPNIGTAVFGIVNQYTNDQLSNLQRDIKEEIAEGIGKLFQEIERIDVSTTSDQSSHPALYLPTEANVEFAESQLRKSPEEVIGIEDVLNQIEEHFQKAGKQLKPNWREITRKNIGIWFKS